MEPARRSSPSRASARELAQAAPRKEEATFAAMGATEERVSMPETAEADGGGEDDWRGEPLTIESLCMNCYQNVSCSAAAAELVVNKC